MKTLFAEPAVRPAIGDGAMGTELQRAGLEAGTCGDAWNLDHPDRVERIHRSYVDAGSEAIITNSFGSNRWVLGRYGLADKVESINRAAAEIALRAVEGRAKVLGDIGPFGGFLAPLGDVPAHQVGEAFERQAYALLEGGAAGIIIETMTALDEAVAAVEAARRAGAPFVAACMSYDRLRDGSIRTMMGVAPAQAARALADAGADAVGANCGTKLEPADFARIVELMREEVPLPIVIEPNAGQPELSGLHVVYRLSPEDFAGAMREVVSAGASIVGGCCGTTPAHIRALAVSVGAVAP
jgi:5-methyltetrahydrofolate--homocysteine methyltransferase